MIIILFFILCGAGALLGTCVSERRSSLVLAWTGSLASLLMLWMSVKVLFAGEVFQCSLWTIGGLGTLSIALDRVSALFLAVTSIVFLACSIYSAGYLKRYIGHYSLKALNACYLLLLAFIVLILMARDALMFLMAWEMMSILTYLLVNFEHRRAETAGAGYLMLAMSEAGFIAVIVVFLFFGVKAGTLDFCAFKQAGEGFGMAARWMIFLLTFFGFGVKAGLVPINTWLPRAHPVAPANISALLSTVILNLGLYGIVRVNLDLLPVTGVGEGLVVLIVGTISALVGILYATTENDLKTMFAHSSIENIGIITVGLGAGMVFGAYGKPVLAGIAFIAAFYHLMNHSIYKALLFFGAGAVDDSTGTRDLNKLGGLIRTMPWTAGVVLVGTLAIAALPPFNGFVSEWLTLQTMLRSAELPSIVIKLVFALCGAGLALTMALAVTCFVKAFGMGFLGMPRSEQAGKAREAKAAVIIPMVLLAVLCLLLGVLPTYVVPALNHQLQPWTNGAANALVPPFFNLHPAHKTLPVSFMKDFHNLGAQVGQNVFPGRGLVILHRGAEANPVVFAMSTPYMLVVLFLLLVLTYFVVRWFTRKRRVIRRERWDGGVRRLLPEMTYTATGFSNPVRVVFDAIFRPTTVEDTRETVAQHFRMAIRREKDQIHLVDKLVFHPVKAAALWLARSLAAMHHGRINVYSAYVLIALLAALLLRFLL